MPWWSRGWFLPLSASRQAPSTWEKEAEPPDRSASPDALRLAQRAAGNQALAHAARDPRTPHSLRSALPRMRPRQRLTAPGRAIRVFDDGAAHAAAEEMGAFAFSWRGDIFLGDRLGRAGAPTRDEALRHERVHALQARRRGPRVSEAALEREAEHGQGGTRLAADPDRPHGLWWIVPLAVGAYILLRPKVANAPGPRDTPVASPSDAQIVGEALALFAVPGGVAKGLARLGYGVVAAYAMGGAASAVSFRGVQDAGAGQFSGVEAYIVDAGTGAVIGAIVGGVARLFAGPTVNLGSGGRPGLTHLTSMEGEAGITAQKMLHGRQGIYAIPSSTLGESTAMRVARTLLRAADTARAVGIPETAAGAFSRPVPIGPLSLYQRLMGVHRAPAGAVNLATGGFEAGGRFLPNLTGQFFPYGVDGLIWLGAGTIGATLSPATDGARERGVGGLLDGLLARREPLPETRRDDGPFVLLNDPALSVTGDIGSGAVLSSSLACEDPGSAAATSLVPPSAPAIILVTPLSPWQGALNQR